jgi:hypothetical protein
MKREGQRFGVEVGVDLDDESGRAKRVFADPDRDLERTGQEPRLVMQQRCPHALLELIGLDAAERMTRQVHDSVVENRALHLRVRHEVRTRSELGRIEEPAEITPNLLAKLRFVDTHVIRRFAPSLRMEVRQTIEE